MRRNTKDLIKALKRSAKEDFGFEPTKISSSARKYSRSRENAQWKRDFIYV